MEDNKVFLHCENGIVLLKINDKEIPGVKDYKVVSSANGETELTFTISAKSSAIEIETCLATN